METIDPDDPFFPIMQLEEINRLRAEIDAIDHHILWLRDVKGSALDIGAAQIEKSGLIRRLDKLMGL